MESKLANFGLKNDYERLSYSASQIFCNLRIRAEAIEIDANKEEYGVSRVVTHNEFPFLLICLDLSQLNINREFAEFVGLDLTKELHFELELSP